ncbi:MAG TPA: hypothetical protein VGY55_12850 [Pirellulales bacterium]|jgi:hypothetical protein|nr:hypothetical protein [Pirellulales bacterium]
MNEIDVTIFLPQRAPRTRREVKMEYDPIPEADEELATRIIRAAIEVHRELGPGFIELKTVRQIVA